MTKLQLTRPVFILVYGYPGAGKTFLSRQLCEDITAAHIQGERIRYELFEKPTYDRQENEVVDHLMNYMAEEFLNAGVSVVYDANALRFSQRRSLRDMARKTKAQPLLIWIQIDVESAFTRVVKRDRRKADDRFAMPLDRTSFDSFASRMQNPGKTEDYIVISGKHNYRTQRDAIVKKLYDSGLVLASNASTKLVKPELTNLVPNLAAGRVDPSRRNIIIR